MPFRIVAVIALTALLSVACGDIHTTVQTTTSTTMTTTLHRSSTPVPTTRPVSTGPRSQRTTPHVPATAAQLRLWRDTIAWNAAAARARAETGTVSADQGASIVLPPPATISPSLEPCGGTDYPPCYVAARESGGDYGAYNPHGCDGHGCYGKWQFSGAWACRLGLPCDLATATPEQQDNAARILWNGGAGCSNWGAC